MTDVVSYWPAGESPWEAGDTSGAVVVLFTKNPVPGRVKTRLIGDLTADQAADLHRALVGDMVAELQGGRYRFEISWSLGDQEEPELEMVPSGVCFSRQVGRDLGERLLRALREAARSASWVVAVGSDHPRLRQTRVEEAIARLRQGHDVVLGPAIDGGYYLIALRANAVERRLFSGIAWSTAAVLDQTLERCREVGLEVALLAPESDVDTPADLERLIQELRASPQDCPRTRLLLERWGRLNGSETR